MARPGKITVDLDVNVNGCSPVPEQGSVVDDRLALPLDAVVDLHRHVNQLTVAFGPAMTAVLRDLLTELDARMAGAERGLRMEFGRLQRLHDGAVEWAREEQQARDREVDALAELLAEVERRNRRSHAKPSRVVARARKVVDQHNQDRGA